MTLTADGNSEITTTPGKAYAFAASGTFGSGTLKLQYSLDGGTTWVTFNDGSADVSLTAAGGRLITAPSRKARFNLAGSSAASITASLEPTV